MSSPYSGPNWGAHAGYNRTASQLEQEFAQSQLQYANQIQNQPRYPQSNQPGAAPVDRNLWPQRSQLPPNGSQSHMHQPTGYPPDSLTSRANPMQNYGPFNPGPPQMFSPPYPGSMAPPPPPITLQPNQDYNPYPSPGTSNGVFSTSPAMTQPSLPVSSLPTTPVSPPVGHPMFSSPPPRSGMMPGVERQTSTKRPRLSEDEPDSDEQPQGGDNQDSRASKT